MAHKPKTHPGGPYVGASYYVPDRARLAGAENGEKPGVSVPTMMLLTIGDCCIELIKDQAHEDIYQELWELKPEFAAVYGDSSSSNHRRFREDVAKALLEAAYAVAFKGVSTGQGLELFAWQLSQPLLDFLKPSPWPIEVVQKVGEHVSKSEDGKTIENVFLLLSWITLQSIIKNRLLGILNVYRNVVDFLTMEMIRKSLCGLGPGAGWHDAVTHPVGAQEIEYALAYLQGDELAEFLRKQETHLLSSMEDLRR